MRANSYCKVCGGRNPPNIASCLTCNQEMVSAPRSNPVNSASFRSQSMIIFDIDDTILNVAQRYKDAKRAHLIDKESHPIRKKTLETPGKARKRANQFLFSPENLKKDRVIPGALGLIDDLVAQGHIVAYVTARHSNFRDVTRNQLEDKGFPLFKNDAGMELLFLKATLGEKTAKYKHGVYDQLIAQYDVRMVFDDQPENLQAAVSVGITGVYPSIGDYTRYEVKSNPEPFYSSMVDDKGYPIEDPDADPYDTAESHNDTSGMGRTGVSFNPPIKTDILPIMSGEPTTQHKKLGAVFAEVQVGRNIFVDVGEVIQDIYRGLIGGRQSMSEKRMAMAIATMEKELSDRAKKLGGNAIANLKLDFELPSKQGKVLNLIATADAIKMRSPPKAVLNNPANPSKVSKGKKLYKHMNGKLPESVDVKKIDMGDVWYQVGEGGCWSIGYMSGKETGKSEQKYTHTFNEETKDGNFPKLYATMPENGKPLLIIQGGTWKIRTDDTGVAWIYD